MEFDNQPMTRSRGGTIIQFLRRNYFRVRLDDGQEVIAAAPEKLLPLAAEFKKLKPGYWISVHLKMQKPPRLHRIVRVRSPRTLTG